MPRHNNPARRRPPRRVYTKPSMLRCPTCHKMMAYSEQEAWTMAMDYYNERGGVKPERVYPCPADPLVFHWTSMKKYEPRD